MCVCVCVCVCARVRACSVDCQSYSEFLSNVCCYLCIENEEPLLCLKGTQSCSHKRQIMGWKPGTNKKHGKLAASRHGSIKCVCVCRRWRVLLEYIYTAHDSNMVAKGWFAYHSLSR